MRRRSGQTEGDGIARRRRRTVTSYSSQDDWIQMPSIAQWPITSIVLPLTDAMSVVLSVKQLVVVSKSRCRYRCQSSTSTTTGRPR